MRKQEILEKNIQSLGKVAIAYSGGIDSSYLLYVANKVLPQENVIAIIANGIMITRKDYEEAIQFLKENNFRYIEVPYKPLEITEFKENHKDRCYHCKKALMTALKKVANENGYENLLDGKNADDLTVYRPGNKATEEMGVISPLAKFEISKEEIRQHSKILGIPFWNNPSNSCLATRFPYNTNLTEEGLKKVEQSEEIIKSLGIKKVRVRVHENIARIEVNPEEFEIIFNNIENKNKETKKEQNTTNPKQENTKEQNVTNQNQENTKEQNVTNPKQEDIVEKIKELGFSYVTLDLSGLKSGSFD